MNLEYQRGSFFVLDFSGTLRMFENQDLLVPTNFSSAKDMWGNAYLHYLMNTFPVVFSNTKFKLRVSSPMTIHSSSETELISLGTAMCTSRDGYRTKLKILDNFWEEDPVIGATLSLMYGKFHQQIIEEQIQIGICIGRKTPVSSCLGPPPFSYKEHVTAWRKEEEHLILTSGLRSIYMLFSLCGVNFVRRYFKATLVHACNLSFISLYNAWKEEQRFVGLKEVLNKVDAYHTKAKLHREKRKVVA